MSSHITYTYQDLPSKLKARLTHSLTDGACFAYAEAPSGLTFYGLHGAAFLVALCLFWTVLRAGYGDPLAGSGWDNRAVMVLYLPLVAAMAFLVLRCLRRFELTRLFGFAPGRYVMSFAIIDAATTRVGISDLAQMKALNMVHYTNKGRYIKSTLSLSMLDGKLHVFTVRNKRRAEAFYERFHALQAETRQSFGNRDLDKLRRLDPLVELRQNKWQMPAGRRVSPPPTSLERFWSNQARAGGVIALVLAPLLWAGRNGMNDVAMYRKALILHTEAAADGYLEHGHFYAAQMRAAMPRIAFDEAVKAGTVTALRKVLARYPDAGLNEEVAAEIHACYQRGLERFLAQAVRSDHALVQSMRELLAQVEARGNPAVPVRFLRPTSAQLVELDRALQRRGGPNGRKIIPASAYFSSNSAGAREMRIVASLQSAFRTIFPGDVLTLVNGAPKDNRQPVLDIRYDIEPSGAVHVSEKDDGRGFVGLLVRFDSALIPSETATPWRFKLQVKPPEHFTVQYKQGAGNAAAGPRDGDVYRVMAERAFDSLDGAITAALFRPDSEVMMHTLKKTNVRTSAQASRVTRS